MTSRPRTAIAASTKRGPHDYMQIADSATQPGSAAATSNGKDGKDDKVNSAALAEEQQRLLERLRGLERERETFSESTGAETRRNRAEILRLRQENKEMKAALTNAKRGGGNIIENELRQLDGNIYTTTLKLDKTRDKIAEYTETIRTQQNQLEEIHKNSKPVVTEDSAIARKIRLLENRLDKSLIKYNEAVSIRRTYEQIVKRLKEEQIGFDNQLAAIERTLAAKAHDYQELLNMSHQANAAKEAAKKELQDFQQAYAAERIAKDDQLAKKKSYVQSKADQTFKLERREKQLKQREAEAARQQMEEDQQLQALSQNRGAIAAGRSNTDVSGEDGQLTDSERLAQYENAFKTIRESTGVTDVNELLQKYSSQEETRRHLQQSVHESQTRIDQLQTEIEDLNGKLDELRYSGSGQLGSRRIVEEFEVHLAETERQTITNGEKYEATVKLLISAKAGIEHLVDLLQNYKPDLVPPAVKDETAVDALKVVEQKLSSLADEVMPAQGGTDGSRSPGGYDALVAVEPPAYNLRVHLPRPGANGLDEDGIGDDDEHDADHLDDPADDAVLRREQVKKISVNAIQRETKKLKRRRK